MPTEIGRDIIRAGGTAPSVVSHTLRVAIVADMLEERWASMDLVADALMDELPRQQAWPVEPELVRASFVPLLRWLHPDRPPSTAERVFNRFWLYRRALASTRGRCYVHHIVDHSYAHLATALRPARTIVTCHDIDTFRGFLTSEPTDTRLPRFLVNRLVRGLRHAALVACPSRATARELVEAQLVTRDRIVVVPNGVARPASNETAVREAQRLLQHGSATVDVLHVGNAAPRKRLDLLLEVVGRVAANEPHIRLLRAGAPMTAAQSAHAEQLGLTGRIVSLPFLTRETLFEIYRRARVLLMTSDREGFGLPVIEALSVGIPVIARDLPVLREVGGDAPMYLDSDDPSAWASAVARVLAERDGESWRIRREAGRVWASQFSWRRYATEMARLYAHVAGLVDSAAKQTYQPVVQ